MRVWFDILHAVLEHSSVLYFFQQIDRKEHVLSDCNIKTVARLLLLIGLNDINDGFLRQVLHLQLTFFVV